MSSLNSSVNESDDDDDEIETEISDTETDQEVIENVNGNIVNVSQIITPNGDTSNDFLKIKEFWKLKNATIFIYDYNVMIISTAYFE